MATCVLLLQRKKKKKGPCQHKKQASNGKRGAQEKTVNKLPGILLDCLFRSKRRISRRLQEVKKEFKDGRGRKRRRGRENERKVKVGAEIQMFDRKCHGLPHRRPRRIMLFTTTIVDIIFMINLFSLFLSLSPVAKD